MIKFLLFLPIWFCGTLLAYPLVPIAVYLSDKHGRLPVIFRWLETPDALGWNGGLFEPAVEKTRKKYGEQAALIHWLWRNKAYGLRQWMKATPNKETMKAVEYGNSGPPPKFGPYFWGGKITDVSGSWFEYSPGFAFGFFHVYLRIGWKLKPYFNGVDPAAKTSAGFFTGITPRFDDWDDYK